MSTFPILYLYSPKNKINKRVIRGELRSPHEERIPQSINSFFLKKPLQEFMWIVTAERGDGYKWNLHYPLESSFKLLEVIDVSNDM